MGQSVATLSPVGDVFLGDLPLRNVDSTGGKLEQYADIICNVQLNATQDFLDNTWYRLLIQEKYSELPAPFCVKKEPTVPYSLQIVVLPAAFPPNQEVKFVNIVKHVYLYRNKLTSKECLETCQGSAFKFDWGQHVRVALMALNYMMDRMGGMQLRLWTIKPKFEKKATLDQQARELGYRFICEKGPRSKNKSQVMEWTDEQVNTPGGPLEGWNEGKVKEALYNHMRGRQNAKTLEYWPLTLRSFVSWFLDDVLVHMLPTMRQHSITWFGRSRTGKSLGSKTVLFAQSKYEITLADRQDDLTPSVVTEKHLDFFKAEPITKFKPGVFDDGMLQKMDSSFLKAFLNPSVSRLVTLA